MTTPPLFALGAFLLAYYYFVLRRFNTLGFRMLSLFFFVGISVIYWWYTGYRELKAVEENGITTEATVLKKSSNNGVPIVQVRVTDSFGKISIRTQTGGLSDDEFATVIVGQPVSILYSSDSDTFSVSASYHRQLTYSLYFLVFPGLLFLSGILSWVFLPQYKVGSHNGTMFEYVTDEAGNILYDTKDNAHKAFIAVRPINKLVQLFQRP